MTINPDDAPPGYYAVEAPNDNCDACAFFAPGSSCRESRQGVSCVYARADSRFVVFRPRSELAYSEQPRGFRNLLVN